jgi:predicted O-linked N-acetylglucosamine transferase (SPINDLY family)
VAYLMSGVLERHDRGAFELYALSLRPADESPYGRRIRSAVDRFIDLSALSDEQAAELIRTLEIDILVDLVGYTQGARSGILSRRPAPIQVNYLGFPGTLAAPYIDYLLADEYLIPEQQQPHYSEQIVYLPECFQANDDRRFLPQSIPSRGELGLPEQALVLCCFNNTYKINPTLFSLWMRLLHSVPESVLWLLAGSPLIERNLRAEAAARGIDPARLLFAPRLPYEQHLARLAAADLFLDTLPFNGGTTVSDALWVGLPVLSCSGEALAARMGGSLLRAIGLSELIAADLPHYEQLALELLSSRERLASLRERLIAQRSASPLFNTARFTRHLEQALLAMHHALELQRPPAHVHLAGHS